MRSAFVTKGVIFYKNLPLRNKIMLMTTLLLLLSTIIILSFVYVQSKDIIESKNYDESHEATAQIAKYFNEKLTNIVVSAQSIFMDESFRKSLENILWNSQYNYAVELSTMQTLLQNAQSKDPFIDTVFLYTNKGLFCTSLYQLKPHLDFERTKLFLDYEKDSAISWQSAAQSEIFINAPSVVPIVLNTRINNVENRAVLVVNLKYSAFVSNLSDTGRANNADIYILNTDNSLVASVEENKNDDDAIGSLLAEKSFQDKINVKNGYFNYLHNRKKLYVNCARIPINGWNVVMIQPESEILKGISVIQTGIVLTGLFSITLTCIISVFVARTITKPLAALNDTISKIHEGKLDFRFHSRYSDEVSQLGRNFNEMLDDIQSLIRDLELEREKTQQEQRQKRKAEMKALQAQINPHFLYNTLDSIYWKSQMGENEKVGDMIISLSNLLRIGLSKGQDRIPLSKEIEHVGNYLFLQKNMYPGKFDYEIQTGSDLPDCSIIKIILQPLVENSLLHGFDKIDYKGKITVKADAVQGRLHLTVTDNGSGMDVKKVLKSLREEEREQQGYALKNVYQRLKIDYGGEFELKLQSEPYKVTTVEIILPLEGI